MAASEDCGGCVLLCGRWCHWPAHWYLLRGAFSQLVTGGKDVNVVEERLYQEASTVLNRASWGDSNSPEKVAAQGKTLGEKIIRTLRHSRPKPADTGCTVAWIATSFEVSG